MATGYNWKGCPFCAEAAVQCTTHLHVFILFVKIHDSLSSVSEFLLQVVCFASIDFLQCGVMLTTKFFCSAFDTISDKHRTLKVFISYRSQVVSIVIAVVVLTALPTHLSNLRGWVAL